MLPVEHAAGMSRCERVALLRLCFGPGHVGDCAATVTLGVDFCQIMGLV